MTPQRVPGCPERSPALLSDGPQGTLALRAAPRTGAPPREPQAVTARLPAHLWPGPLAGPELGSRPSRFCKISLERLFFTFSLKTNS